jgi:hypothetical protein
VYLYTPDAMSGAIEKIALLGEAAPGGGTFNSFTASSISVHRPALAVNPSGVVVFTATANLRSGIFYGSSTSAPGKIVVSGDLAPEGGTFLGVQFLSSFSADGHVVFTSGTTAPSESNGVFTAPLAGPITVVARGYSAGSAGGSLVFDVFPLANLALGNPSGDVAFQAAISDGSADSGYFRVLASGPEAGTLQPILLQGQPVPGGDGEFATVPTVGPLQSFAVGPDGAVAAKHAFVANASRRSGVFLLPREGPTERLLGAGDSLLGGSVNALLLNHFFAAGRTGTFVFWAGAGGAGNRQGIFASNPPD